MKATLLQWFMPWQIISCGKKSGERQEKTGKKYRPKTTPVNSELTGVALYDIMDFERRSAENVSQKDNPRLV